MTVTELSPDEAEVLELYKKACNELKEIILFLLRRLAR